MGTSNPFKGGNNNNPLVPDWVDEGGPAPDGPDHGPPGGDNPDLPRDPGAPEPKRFQSGRANFYKFAKTGGGGGGGGGADRNLRRAIGSFVGKASGGAKQAARRMAAERSATANLGRILSSAGAVGIQEAVRRRGYPQLAMLPVPEIYAALVDVICSPGGELDESFARDAYVKALIEITRAQADLERPSPETTASFLASFIANAIQNRLLNAIGNKVVVIPRDAASVQNIEQQINDYIRGNVNDAFAGAGAEFPVEQIVPTIDAIYEDALALLEDWEPQAGNDEVDLEADDDFDDDEEAA